MKKAIRPPWEIEAREVRPDYAAGLWDYALGRPAFEHDKYGEAVRQAEKDKWNPWYIRSWLDVDAALAGHYVDESIGREKCAFFEDLLVLHKGRKWAGKPFKLIDWQRYDFIGRLFSWVHHSDEWDETVRRFVMGCAWLPKKQGKSGLCSGLGLNMTVADGEPGAEVYSAAGDRQQASIIHAGSSKMVKNGPLVECCECIDSRNTILHAETDSLFRALSADAALQEGLDWSAVFFDELHVQKKRVLFETLEGGGAARMQPLMLAVSTAGVYDVTSIAWEQWEYSLGVSKGTLPDLRYFALVYRHEEPEKKDGEEPDPDATPFWHDLETFKRANPSYGVTVQPSFYQDQINKAKNSPEKLMYVTRYFLNMWANSVSQWLDMSRWEQCAMEYGEADLFGRKCYAALDLAAKVDLCSLALCFPPEAEEEPYKLLSYSWAPENKILTEAAKGRHAYSFWRDAGHLIETPGDVVDQEAIRQTIRDDLAKKFKILDVAFDDWNATKIASDLQSDGFVCQEHRQGYKSLSEPMKTLEAFVLDRKLAHNGDPVQTWGFGNVVIDQDPAGNIKYNKEKSTQKIDPAAAGIMAFGRAFRCAGIESVYENQQGVKTV